MTGATILMDASNPTAHPSRGLQPARCIKRRGVAQPATAVYCAIATLYLIVGLGLLASSLWMRDYLGLFVGFLAIGAALTIAMMARMLIELQTRLTAAGDSLTEVRGQLARMEQDRMNAGPSEAEDSVELIDLASMGKGDPAPLTAATLDRHVFPRLVTAMSDEPMVGAEPAAGAGSTVDPTPAIGFGAREQRVTAGLTARNLLDEWHVALRDADLATCRRLYATLVDTADPKTVAPLTILLKTLSKHVEHSLRERFAQHVKERNYAGALHVGDEICKLFPDHGIATEFERIRPHLTRRVI